MVAEFRARRDLIVDGLNAIPGIRCRRPHGAFYVFPNVSGTGLTGAELADRLLYEAGVCVLAGTAFGRVGVDHIRISYANSAGQPAPRRWSASPTSWLGSAQREPGYRAAGRASSSPDGSRTRG